MKYTVTINEKSRSITVTLADGTKGVARCNPSDRFDINTGVELALERAKNAKKETEAKKNATATQMSVTMLAKQLEKVLPKGHIVVAVGGGDECLTEQGKKWLATLAGVSTKCHCPCCDCDEDDGDYDSGYDDGYADGYADAEADYEECEGCEEYSEAMARIVAILEEVGAID